MKIGTILLLALGVVITLPTLKMNPVTDFASRGDGPVFAGSLFPFVFITIACGALSGFHALISSGTTPKMIQKETQVRMIGYGSMLMESAVAVMALVAASIIDPGLYFAMNAPAGVIGDNVQAASQAVSRLQVLHLPRRSRAGRQERRGVLAALADRWRAHPRGRRLRDLLEGHRRLHAGLLVPLRDHV